MPRALHKKPRHQQQRVKDKKSGRVETTDGPKDKRVRAKNRNGDQDAQLSFAKAHQRGCLDPVTAMCRARCPDSKCGIHGAGCPELAALLSLGLITGRSVRWHVAPCSLQLESRHPASCLWHSKSGYLVISSFLRPLHLDYCAVAPFCPGIQLAARSSWSWMPRLDLSKTGRELDAWNNRPHHWLLHKT